VLRIRPPKCSSFFPETKHLNTFAEILFVFKSLKTKVLMCVFVYFVYVKSLLSANRSTQLYPIMQRRNTSKPKQPFSSGLKTEQEPSPLRDDSCLLL
jgi:hypothetical protein